ncbi:hypothetical protein [Actinomadura sediminis]|uniref:LacI family transcriptional regulator n=1 Tax=Actinomadura sediminis TaxID=1038904 RepID=A0ABW3EIJ6_9ACTN
MGRIAIDLLLERMRTPELPAQHRLLTPGIVLRASTGPAPVPGD